MTFLDGITMPRQLIVVALAIMLVVAIVYSYRVSWRNPCAALGVFGMGSSSAVCLYWMFNGGNFSFAGQLFILAITLFFVCRAISPKTWPLGPFDDTNRAPLGDS
jgi:hypothetical protein